MNPAVAADVTAATVSSKSLPKQVAGRKHCHVLSIAADAEKTGLKAETGKYIYSHLDTVLGAINFFNGADNNEQQYWKHHCSVHHTLSIYIPMFSGFKRPAYTRKLLQIK